MSTNEREQSVVHEGWLTKSPPTNGLWKARWRRRWFSLKHSGELPDQYVLTYYADKQCRKLKGSIDLDQCEQVDLGLRMYEKKMKFDYVFDIKTPHRTYYLAADSENEMKTWVNVICRVCALKCTASGIEIDSVQLQTSDVEIVEVQEDGSLGTPPISPVSTGPYIRISECFTGTSPVLDHQTKCFSQDYKTLLEHNLRNSKYRNTQHANETYEFPQRTYVNCVNGEIDPRFYDCPRKLNVPEDSPQSPTDSENVFFDEDCTERIVSSRPSDGSVDVEVSQKMQRMGLENKGNATLPPPRPPKPPHISTVREYFNLSLPTRKSARDRRDSAETQKSGAGGDGKLVSDDWYDFPRSHQMETENIRNTLSQRHNYNNAAPGSMDGHVFKYDLSPRPGTSTTVFKYDTDDAQDEPASPSSQTSSTAMYSNLPSPAASEPPPAINRGLKPKKSRSDSMSTTSNPEPPSPHSGPSIDRKLKPLTPSAQTGSMRKAFECEEDRRTRAAPSPTPPGLARSHECVLHADDGDEAIYHRFPGKKMQYLDLDLDLNTSKFSQSDASTLPLRSPGASTVYKRVDFMKTEAFNITRNNLEMERNKESVSGGAYFKK